MTGLQKLCKLYGKMTINKEVWIWDYKNDVAIRESEMPHGSPRWQASEAAKWAPQAAPEASNANR